MEDKKRRWDRKIVLALLIGAFAGIVLFAGSSKAILFTDEPGFCSSCHVAEDVHAAFLESNHSMLTCNDCHLPNESMVGKYTHKAKTGLSHLYNNTFKKDSIPDTVLASDATKSVVNGNCLRCHETTVQSVAHQDIGNKTCMSCHGSVAHGEGMYKPRDWFKPGNVDVNYGR